MKTASVLRARRRGMWPPASRRPRPSDRYAERPPVMVSPDLSAPWVHAAWPRAGHRAAGEPAGRCRPAAASSAMRPSRVRLSLRRPARSRAERRRPAHRGIAPAARSRGEPQIDPIYLPQEVAYDGPQKPGTIVIDTTQNFLYPGRGGRQGAALWRRHRQARLRMVGHAQDHPASASGRTGARRRR